MKQRGLQEFTELIHHIPLMFHQGVNISVQCDGRIFMPEYFRKGFDIHAAFNCTGRKGMSECMEAVFGDLQLFEEKLKAALIGADEKSFASVGYDIAGAAVFFHIPENRKDLFR